MLVLILRNSSFAQLSRSFIRPATCSLNNSFSSSASLAPSTSYSLLAAASTSTHPTLSLRYVRTAPPPDDQRKGEHDKEKAEGQEQQRDPKKEFEEFEREFQKRFPQEKLRKIRRFMLITMGVTFSLSLFLSYKLFNTSKTVDKDIANEAINSPSIGFREFVEKYLKVGEVDAIYVSAGRQFCIAKLHEGAQIDGRPARAIKFNYSGGPGELWADIRREEALLGVGLENGVKIEGLPEFSPIRLISMMIGVGILFWLGAKYSQAAKKQILEMQMKQAKEQAKKQSKKD